MLLAAATALAVALALAPAAGAATRRQDVGIAEQSPAMFANPRWQSLGLRDVRVLVSWDALLRPWEREQLDLYMAAAQRAGVRVLLSLGRSRSEMVARRRLLPSVARYLAQFRALRARYPFVQDFLVWNEANHPGQPTAKHPARAAAYYNAVRRRCAGCRIVAADVLDTSNMVSWLTRFRRVATGSRPIWGLHNYVDANRFRTSGTRDLLRATRRGDVWFTETGGLVVRRNGSRIEFPGSIYHAARATRQVFKLAGLSGRVKRVYFYDFAPSTDLLPTWDSALTDEQGAPRPAYDVLSQWLQEHPPRVPFTPAG